MNCTSVSTLVLGIALAGSFGPARAASLPTDAAKDQAGTARLVVENVGEEPSATPWVVSSLESSERVLVGPTDESSELSSARWKTALAADASPVESALAAASLSAESFGPETKAVRFGLPTDDEVAAAGFQFDSPVPGPRGESSRLTWQFLLMLMPMLGGVFIACDARGARRKRSGGPHALVMLDWGGAGRPFTPVPLEALGLTAASDEEDVKRAFRHLAMSAHPDRGGDAQKFMALQSHFEQSLKIVRAAKARLAVQTASRRAA